MEGMDFVSHEKIKSAPVYHNIYPVSRMTFTAFESWTPRYFVDNPVPLGQKRVLFRIQQNSIEGPKHHSCVTLGVEWN